MSALNLVQSLGFILVPILVLSGIALLWAGKTAAPRLVIPLKASSLLCTTAMVILCICLIVINATCNGIAEKGYHGCSFMPEWVAQNIFNLLTTGFVGAIGILLALFLIAAAVEYKARR